MKCVNCKAELEIWDEGEVICNHCHQPHDIKIGEVFTNVPEFKLNTYLVFISFVLAMIGTYIIWPQDQRGYLASPFLASFAFFQMIIGIRSGYFSSQIGVFFRRVKPMHYYLQFLFYALIFVFFFPIFVLLLIKA